MNITHKIKRIKQFTVNFLANCYEAPVIVLLYHRVGEIENDNQQLFVSPENFEKQIKFLNDNFQILRFEDDWHQVKKPSFVITFDDGYNDNLYHALPILKKYSTPVTFFICSGNVLNGNEFWWDQLEYILLNTKVDFDKLNLPIALSDSSAQAVIQTQLYFKMLSVKDREEFIKRLTLQANLKLEKREQYQPLTIDELKELDAEPLVTIGSHTVNHPQLSALSRGEQEYEINTGKMQLETILGYSVNTFSYPFGNVDDFSNVTMEICKQANIDKVAANFPGQSHSWTDPFKIPRHLVRNWNISEFKKQLFRFKYL